MKNQIGIGVSLCVLVTALATLFPSHAQRVIFPDAKGRQAVGARTQAEQTQDLSLAPDRGARFNPLKIALLHWYLADTTTFFKVGAGPYGVCFDGANVWTANGGDNTVTKVRANDGEVLGTFKVGSQPYGVTFDGANIWVSSDQDNLVTKLRASDGKAEGTFPVGNGPGWMAFDGANVWVPSADGTVRKLRATDGKNVGTFPVGVGAIAAAFDGTSIWVTNYGTNTVTKLRASDGTVLGTFTVGYGPLGIAFDGANMWIANRNDGTVSELRAGDGMTLGTFPASAGPYGVAFDGAYVWVSGDLYLRVFRATDGVQVANHSIQSQGIAFDGVLFGQPGKTSVFCISFDRRLQRDRKGRFRGGKDP